MTLNRGAGAVILLVVTTVHMSACSTTPAASPAVGSAPPPDGAPGPVPDIADMAYGDGDPRQRLDLYLPEAGDGPHPLVVYIHGGAWWWGDKERVRPYARGLLDRGLAVASINYRYSTQAPFPAQIHDCKGAIRWLRAHAGAYDLDPRRIGVYGHSAGAHLAALLATSGDVVALEGAVGGNLGESSRVLACADFYGATDLFELRLFRGTDWSESTLTGVSVGEALAHVDDPGWADRIALIESANPIHHVTIDDAAMYILHGEADDVIPAHPSGWLAAELAAALVPVTYVPVPRQGHESTPAQQVPAQDFLAERLTVPDLPGDLNRDGRVAAADVLLVVFRWGACPAAPAACSDVDGDGTVDASDLLHVLAHWTG